MFRLELVLKEDFLAIYFDPYYDISLDDDKERFVISLDKKK